VTVRRDVRVALKTIQMVAGSLGPRPPAEARRGYARLAALARKAEVAEVLDWTIAGPGGGVPLRTYVPAEAIAVPGPGAPVLVWFHGGGWVIGDLEVADATARALANAAGMAVVSVDYRLAPEHPFPAALDDAVAAVRAVADDPGHPAVDGRRLAVGGDSAGGNLATVVCQELRDRGPSIGFQLLVYPVTDLGLSSRSMRENGEGYFLTHEAMLWFRRQYLADGDPSDPRVSPLHAPRERLAGLPPALVITAELDPLRDEGLAYADRLRAAGVACEVARYDGMIHGFVSLSDVLADGREAIDRAGRALRAALTPTTRPAVP
jgi:acetyl esterase